MSARLSGFRLAKQRLGKLLRQSGFTNAGGAKKQISVTDLPENDRAFQVFPTSLMSDQT